MSSARKINYLLITGSQIFSALYLVILKQLDRAVVDGDIFYHPYCQILLVSISQCLCYFLFSLYKSNYPAKYEEDINEANKKGRSPHFKIYIFAIPSLLSFTTQVLQVYAKYLTQAWSFQFQNGFLVIMALSTIFILKKKIHRQQWLGLSLNYFGQFFIGLLIYTDLHPSPSNIQYYFVYVISWFSYTAQISCEEMLYSKFQLNPAQVAAYEGMFGIIYASIGVLISGFLNCASTQPCYYYGDSQDNFGQFMKQVFSFSNVNVFFLVFGGILFATFSICVGQAIIKQMSGLAKTVLDTSSLFFYWIFLLILQQEDFKWYYLFGYLFCISGAVIFCEIFVFPCLGFDKKRGRIASSAQVQGQQYHFQNQYASKTNYQKQNPDLISNQQQLNQNKAADNKKYSQQNQISYQPLLGELESESYQQQQPRPSNIKNQNSDQIRNQNQANLFSNQNSKDQRQAFQQQQADQNPQIIPVQQAQNEILIRNNSSTQKQPSQQLQNQQQIRNNEINLRSENQQQNIFQKEQQQNERKQNYQERNIQQQVLPQVQENQQMQYQQQQQQQSRPSTNNKTNIQQQVLPLGQENMQIQQQQQIQQPRPSTFDYNQDPRRQSNNQQYYRNQKYQGLYEALEEIETMQLEKMEQIKQIVASIEDIQSRIPSQENELKYKVSKILQKIAGALIKNYSNTIKMKILQLILEDQYENVYKINQIRYIQDRLYFLVNNNNISSQCINQVIRWIEDNLQPSELALATQTIQTINQQFINEQQRDQQNDINWTESYKAIQKKVYQDL
ncbi:hypothetical protein ABPG74_007208 [Tetrahymena malaccensis]